MNGKYYVDSSVVLRATMGGSPATVKWFKSQAELGGRFIGSRVVELEVRRVGENTGVPSDITNDYLDKFDYVSVDDELFDEAIALDVPLGSADSLHVATALRLGTDTVTLVTHNAQMAAAARTLGFTVIDPVTDDPRSPPVA